MAETHILTKIKRFLLLDIKYTAHAHTDQISYAKV